MKFSGWRKRSHRDGSFTLLDGKKYIHVHKSMGEYWVDYGMQGGTMRATMHPSKTLNGAWKKVEAAKSNFRMEKVS